MVGVRTGLAASPVPVVDEGVDERVAPVVVVIADSRGGIRLRSYAVGHIHLALGDRGQPVELVLTLGAEVRVAGAGPPCWDRAGKVDVDGYILDVRNDLVAVQITAE
jgi:hypothetical protein